MESDWPPLAYILKPFDRWRHVIRGAEAGLRGVPTMLQWCHHNGVRYGVAPMDGRAI